MGGWRARATGLGLVPALAQAKVGDARVHVRACVCACGRACVRAGARAWARLSPVGMGGAPMPDMAPMAAGIPPGMPPCMEEGNGQSNAHAPVPVRELQ